MSSSPFIPIPNRDDPNDWHLNQPHQPLHGMMQPLPNDHVMFQGSLDHPQMSTYHSGLSPHSSALIPGLAFPNSTHGNHQSMNAFAFQVRQAAKGSDPDFNQQSLSTNSMLSHGQLTPNKSPTQSYFNSDQTLLNSQPGQYQDYGSASHTETPETSEVASSSTHASPVEHGTVPSFSNPFEQQPGSHFLPYVHPSTDQHGIIRGAPNTQSTPNMMMPWGFQNMGQHQRNFMSEPNIHTPGLVPNYQTEFSDYPQSQSQMGFHLNPVVPSQHAEMHSFAHSMAPQGPAGFHQEPMENAPSGSQVNNFQNMPRGSQMHGQPQPPASQAVSRKRKRGAAQPEMSPDARREINLQRNREAAAKCRIKKKDRDEQDKGIANTLEKRNETFKAEREELQAQAMALREAAIKMFSAGHKCKSSDSLADWISQMNTEAGRAHWRNLMSKIENRPDIAAKRARVDFSAKDPSGLD